MPEAAQQTPDASGIVRTATGEISESSSRAPEETPSQPTTTTETKPTTTQPATSTTKTGDDDGRSLLNEGEKAKAPTGAPESYQEFKVPEGYTLDAAAAQEASGLFKTMNLNQEQAQRLVDFYVKKTQESHDAPFKAYVDMRKGWREEASKHAEIGGNLAQVKETVSRAINQLGDAQLASDFRDAMDITGAGDHPAFIRVFYKFAQAVTEGRPVSGNQPSRFGQGNQGRPQTAAHALYPNLP